MSDIAKIWSAIFIGGLLVGLLFLGWIYILGPAFNQASYNNFNNSPQHLNAVAQKFADDCEQLGETTDLTAQKAIEQDIYSVAAQVNLSEVQMPDGVRACVNNAISKVSSGK